MDIAGSSALVTGGASGLGLATAQLLSSAGAQVVILDLPTSPGGEVADKLGEGARFVPGDVRDPDQVQAAAEAAAEVGPLRVAVAAAGVAGEPRRLFGKDGYVPVEQIRRVLDVNVLGTLNVLTRVASLMATTEPVSGERGVVVCTASIAAFDGQIGLVTYSASKGAVVGMTLPAARELARHLVRVVAIAPGVFDTPMVAGLPDETRRSAGAQVPHPSRLGRPEEYAALVEHIVRNPMLNGEVIRLDGAIRLAPR